MIVSTYHVYTVLWYGSIKISCVYSYDGMRVSKYPVNSVILLKAILDCVGCASGIQQAGRTLDKKTNKTALCYTQIITLLHTDYNSFTHRL